MEKKTSLASKLTSSTICAALFLMSPGPSAYAAVGQISTVKAVAPVEASLGMLGGSFNAVNASALGTRLSLTPVNLAADRAPGQSAPVVAVQNLVVPQGQILPLGAPVEQESPISVAETLSAPIPVGLSAAPASADKTAATTVEGPALLGQAQAIKAAPGRMANAAARVQSGMVNTLRTIFASKEATEDIPATVPTAESNGASAASGSLERTAPQDQNVTAQPPAASASAAPAAGPSKFKSIMSWALPILAVAGLVFGLDVGTKLIAAKFLFTVFHECAWRTPLLAGIIPYIGVTAFLARRSLHFDHKVWHWSAKQMGNGRLGFYRVEISGLENMIKDHPSLRWALRLYDLSIGMMLGGMLGNGLDAFRLGGALDWIPLGRSLMNFADLALLAGLAFFQLATSFFMKASEAHHDRKVMYMSTVSFLGLPIVGFFIAWAFGSAATDEPVNMAMKSIAYIYVMGFSMLIGFSRFLAALVVDRFAKRFVIEEEKSKSRA